MVSFTPLSLYVRGEERRLAPSVGLDAVEKRKI
jgi:hypothetical protein